MNKDVIKSVDKLADTYGVEDEAAFALFDVESAGIAFWNVDGKMLPPIRWEGHYFYARLNDVQRSAAVAQGLASPKAGGIKNPSSYAARYALLERAKAINPKAAQESVSWGLGQVMGANWESLGYGSVDELVKASQTIDGQVDMVFKFLVANNIVDDLNNHNWKKVKTVYNGPKANGYERKLAEAYAKYKSNNPATQNADVMQMQNMLNKVGDYKLEVDGNVGPKTILVIKDFQLKNGLTVDGVYGPITKEWLQKRYLEKSSDTNLGVGAAGMGAGTIGTTITEAAKGLQGMAQTSQIIQYVFIGLILVGVAFTVWSMWNNMKAKKI